MSLVLALILGLGAAAGAAGCRSVSRIDPPAVTLRDIEVRSFSGGVADLTLEVQIENGNDFEIALVGLTGSLVLADAEVGQLGWSGELDCPKRQAARARIPLHVTVGEHAEVFNALIDRRPIRHALRGEATFARGVIRRVVPVTIEGQQAR